MNRQHNGQKKKSTKGQRSTKHTHKTKDRVTQTSQKTVMNVTIRLFVFMLIHLKTKVSCTMLCLIHQLFRASIPSIQTRHVGIAKLKYPANLGISSQEIYFVIVVLTPIKEVS
jgi:hypothetical protein